MQIDQNDIRHELKHKCVEVTAMAPQLGTAVQPLEEQGGELIRKERGKTLATYLNIKLCNFRGAQSKTYPRKPQKLCLGKFGAIRHTRST